MVSIGRCSRCSSLFSSGWPDSQCRWHENEPLKYFYKISGIIKVLFLALWNHTAGDDIQKDGIIHFYMGP